MIVIKRKYCAVLHLVLKKKWYDMIERGEKREEYRNGSDYWAARIFNWGQYPLSYVVEFRLGYGRNAPRMTFGVTTFDNVGGPCVYQFRPEEYARQGLSHPEWGEPVAPHYAIALGGRVELED